MGLDTSHDCWHGSYGGFAEFREAVGKAAGFNYRTRKDELGSHSLLDIDWDSVPIERLYGKWGKQPPTVESVGIYDPPITDPVLYLLVHSDCDGKLRRGYLPALRNRLEEIEPAYRAQFHDDSFMAGRLRVFVEGLDRAIAANQHVDFH